MPSDGEQASTCCGAAIIYDYYKLRVIVTHTRPRSQQEIPVAVRLDYAVASTQSLLNSVGLCFRVCLCAVSRWAVALESFFWFTSQSTWPYLRHWSNIELNNALHICAAQQLVKSIASANRISMLSLSPNAFVHRFSSRIHWTIVRMLTIVGTCLPAIACWIFVWNLCYMAWIPRTKHTHMTRTFTNIWFETTTVDVIAGQQIRTIFVRLRVQHTQILCGAKVFRRSTHSFWMCPQNATTHIHKYTDNTNNTDKLRNIMCEFRVDAFEKIQCGCIVQRICDTTATWITFSIKHQTFVAWVFRFVCSKNLSNYDLCTAQDVVRTDTRSASSNFRCQKIKCDGSLRESIGYPRCVCNYQVCNFSYGCKPSNIIEYPCVDAISPCRCIHRQHMVGVCFFSFEKKLHVLHNTTLHAHVAGN